jgi:hypothetical protein
MNVFQRPMFLQAGGPVAPPPMGAPMGPEMDPALMQQAQMVEQAAAQQANELGAAYVQNSLQALDSAENNEQAINAIRGNEKPLEERYRELASLVGEEDAGQTPQSVLTLVQPVIMMTEQGAMDTGLGELMQRMLGDIEMEDEGGQPTDMGQGIGSLMMAGAPEAQPMGVGQQPVANFSQGGVVQRFQAGGEASRLQALYSEMLPVYQSILGDGSDQRRMTQAQILFDIADRAGAFAAGIDPRTGQRVQGSPAAQLAAAASGLGGQIGERLGTQEQQDRALRLSALQAAQGEYSAERADQRAAARAAAAGGRDRALGNLYDIYDGEGNLVQQAVPIATQSEYAQIMERVPGGRIAPTRTAAEPVLREVGGTLYDVADVQNPRVVIPGEGPAPVLREFGGNMYDLSDPLNPQIVIAGETPRDTRIVGGRILDVTDPDNPVVLYEPPAEGPSKPPVNVQMPDGSVLSVREDDPQLDALIRQGGTVVSRTAAQQPSPLIQPDLMQAYARGETSPEETALIQAEIAGSNRSVFNPETGQFERPALTPLVLEAERARADRGQSTVVPMADLSVESEAGAARDLQLAELGGYAFGTGGFLRELGNRAFALVDASAPAQQTQQAVAAVNALNQDALIAFRDLTQGRTAQEAVNQFQNVLPVPATISGSPGRAADQIEQVINFFDAQIEAAQNALRTGVASAPERQRLEAAIIRAQQMSQSYAALRRGVMGGPTGDGTVDPAQFRRR